MFRAKLRTLVCKPPVNCSVTHKPLDNKNNGTCYDCYQFVIKRLIEIAETRINTGFFKQLDLFKLHRCGGFAGDVVEDAVDAGDLVDDTGADPVQEVVGQAGPVGGHEVVRPDGPEGDGVIIRSPVAHDAHGAHIGEGGKILVGAVGELRGGHFLPEDGVGLPEKVQLGLRHLADDPDGKARTREGLAADEILGQPQLPAQLTDLVLEEHPQGLDDLPEVHVVGEAAHVVVALDDGGVAEAGLDDVGVDGALGQEVHLADLLGFLLKDPDELLADDLALVLRLRDAGQLPQEAGLGVHPDEVQVPLGEGLFHLVALIKAHEAVVHKDAGELAAHGLREKRRGHGGIHAAGEGQEHPAIAHLLPDVPDGGGLVVAHAPVALGAADLIEEVAEHLTSILGVVHLGWYCTP